MEQQQPISVGRDLRSYIAVVRHQKWIILAAVVLTVGATIFLTMRQIPSYTSTGQIQVNPVGKLGEVSNVNAATIDMSTERFIASSVEVSQATAERLGLDVKPEDLIRSLRVSIIPETHILQFSYDDADPKVAQERTQAFMDTYLDLRKQVGRDRLAIQRDELEKQEVELVKTVSVLTAKERRSKEGLSIVDATRLTQAEINLNNVRNALRTLKEDPESGGRVTLPADLATAPSSPDWSQNILFSLVIGTVIGLGIAVLREGLSEGLKGSKDLEDAAHAAVLAAVPMVSGWRRRSDTQLVAVADPKSTTSEAYRTLRTNLLYIATLRQASVFALTSATLGEGKSTTTANLAVTLAQTGKRVIAVSCDLRKPRLHRFFELNNDMGVTSIIAGKDTLAEAAQRPANIDTLRVLASGPVPSNPAELLGSQEFDALLDELRLFADIVLVDTPPILAVSDTLIIGPKTDGVIIVADAHNSSKGAVEHTREQLEQVGAEVIGAVFNNFDPTQAKYYPNDKRYYYSGYYSYGYRDAPELDVAPAPTPANGEPPPPIETPPVDQDEMWNN